MKTRGVQKGGQRDFSYVLMPGAARLRGGAVLSAD